MKEDLIKRIKANLQNITEAQRKVADYIIKHPIESAFLTLDQLSMKVGTSTTTIMRLAVSLGYTGYSEFQKELQTMLKTRTSPAMRLESNIADINIGDFKNMWMHCVNQQINAISETASTLSVEDLENCVEELLSAKHLYFASSRGGRPIIQYLSDNLRRMLNKGEMISVDDISWTNIIGSLTDEDAIVAISFPRYSKCVLQFLRAAYHQRDHRPRIISITDTYSSPLTQYSDIVLTCSVESGGPHNSPLAAMLIAEYWISAISIKRSDEVKKRLDCIDSLTTEMGYYWI